MPNDALMRLALLEAGDVEGLIAFHRDHFGKATMTAPAGDPTVVTIPAAPPAPVPTAVAVPADLLRDPAVQAAIEAARKQEKDKLYDTIESEKAARLALEQRMEAFSTDLTERQKAEQAALKAAADAAEEKRLAELSFGEKLTEFQQAQDARVRGLEEQLQQRDALMAKEREFNELLQYRAELLRQHADDIIPDLVDLVQGNTREQLDQAVSAMVDRSASILAGVAAATQQTRQGARGVGVTAPPVGPSDNNSGHETFTTDQLRDMDMSQYAAIRGRLLGAGAANPQQQRGMFG